VQEEIRGLPLHPSPLYEALFLLTLSGALLYAQSRRPPGGYHGRLAALCLGSYGMFRFGFDFLRGDLTPLAAGLAPSQWFGIAVAIAAVIYAKPFGERPR
jgi:prolipoprotein diacylglyceryltransferase